MLKVILLSHILLALTSLGYAGGVIISTAKKKFDQAQNRIRPMWYSMIAVIGSGIFLAVRTRAPMGRFCLTLFSFLAVVLIAHSYQIIALRRWAAATASSPTDQNNPPHKH